MTRKYLEKLKFLKKIPAALKKALDIRDFLLFGGLGMLGYGLWLFRPWVGFAACGAILMAIGYLMRGDK